MLVELQSISCRCQPRYGRQREPWSECAVEPDEVVGVKDLAYQQVVERRFEARSAEQVVGVASCTVAPVMWMESEASQAFALVELQEDVAASLLVVSAIVVIVVFVYWQGKEMAGLMIHWAQCGLEGDEAAVVGRPVDYADMATVEGVHGQAAEKVPEEAVAAAMEPGIPSVTL